MTYMLVTYQTYHQINDGATVAQLYSVKYEVQPGYGAAACQHWWPPQYMDLAW